MRLTSLAQIHYLKLSTGLHPLIYETHSSTLLPCPNGDRIRGLGGYPTKFDLAVSILSEVSPSNNFLLPGANMAQTVVDLANIQQTQTFSKITNKLSLNVKHFYTADHHRLSFATRLL